MRTLAFTSPVIAVLPTAPITGSPVPSLTSLYHKTWRGNYGDPRYPGNCSGGIIKDLLQFFRPKSVFDPMSGSGTCRDVCNELGIDCLSKDIRFGFDACDRSRYDPNWQFEFIWIHPPYHRMKRYTTDPRDLSNCPSLEVFIERFKVLIDNCASILAPGGRLAILMGDYSDSREGYMPLIYHTQRLCFETGLKQNCTQIVRFSHGASSSKKVYRSSFIPGLHDVVTIVEKVQ